MKINKKQYTTHGFERVKERSDFCDKQLNNLSRYAIKNGINISDIPDGRLKKYVWHRIKQRDKRVKLYRGYVFIFFKNSKRLITFYPLPDFFIPEYKEISKKRKKI